MWDLCAARTMRQPDRGNRRPDAIYRGQFFGNSTATHAPRKRRRADGTDVSAQRRVPGGNKSVSVSWGPPFERRAMTAGAPITRKVKSLFFARFFPGFSRAKGERTALALQLPLGTHR